jgi:hypothetical protein
VRVLVLVLLVGCVALPQSQNARGPSGAAAMPPVRSQTSSGDLLYVVDSFGKRVDVYTYPGQSPVMTLTGFDEPSALCTDKAGDVFVTDLGAGDIVEYAHGGSSPIATLSDPDSSPMSCSVDPTTGDLAVANSYVPSHKDDYGDIAIYKHARGAPRIYEDYPKIRFFESCAYDDKGNLYAVGEIASANGLAVMPKGSTSFTIVTLNEGSDWVWGGLQWDGKYLALQRYNRNRNAIYRIAVSGSTGTVVARVPTRGTKFIGGFWIAGNTVVVPNGLRRVDQIGTWRYPAGGQPETEFKVKGTYFIAAVVSSAE